MKKILVAEDDYPLRRNIKYLLEEQGYHVVEAENGKQAFELISRELPDMIVSDVMMPQLDGFELLEKFKQTPLYTAIPFIFLSAKAETACVRKAMNDGADDYITKPFRARELMQVIESRMKKNQILSSRLDSIKKSIAMNFSHELRTPLTPILGYSQYLRDNFTELMKDDVDAICWRITTSGERMLRLVNKLILLVEILCLADDKEQLAISRNSTLDETREIIMKSSSEVAVKFSRTADLYADLQEARLKITEYYLQIIIRELVENAFKFSPKGSVVKISGVRLSESYMIEVFNQGSGFTKEQMKHNSAFEQYERDANAPAGLGVGLTITKKILEVFSGKFEIDNEFQKYTFVRAELPLVNT